MKNTNEVFMMKTWTTLICVVVLQSLPNGVISDNIPEERIKNCSDILCHYRSEGEETICSTSTDECSCHQYSERDASLKCQGLNLLNVTYDTPKILKLTCLEKDDDFQQISSYLKSYLHVIDDRFHKLSVRCGCSSNEDNEFANVANTTETLITANLTNMVCYRSMSTLDLSSNCIEKLAGLFGSDGACGFVRNLDLSHNFLTSIPENSFDKSNTLAFLNLSFNSLNTLSHNSFGYLTTLTKLDLNSNELTEIKEVTFSQLSSLLSLNLTSNLLQFLTGDSFFGLGSLEELDISQNKFESLSHTVFGPLKSLKLLLMHHNKLTFLPENIFYANLHLSYLCISFNQLTLVPSKLLANSPNLTMFLANDNKIASIPAELFRNNHKLYAVSFENNDLNDLPTELLDTSSDYLIIFDISNNNFRQLPQVKMKSDNSTVLGQISIRLINNTISSLDLPITKNLNASIRELDLSDNCIQDMHGPPEVPRIHAFRCVNCCLEAINPNLISNIILSANFSRNKIDKVDMPLLKSLASLLEVDLSYNNIRSVDVSWSYPLIASTEEELLIKETHAKRKVILNHNPIVCDCNLIPFLRMINGLSEPNAGDLKSGMTFVVDELLCSDPPSFRGIPVLGLLQNEALAAQFQCDVISDICPTNCRCYYTIFSTQTIVNCSNRNEPEFPNLSKVKQPILLDLSNTELKNLPPSNSSEWLYFKELYLHNNVLNSLENLNVTPTLTIIYLHDNNLTEFTLPRLIDAFSNNVTVTLAGNPWTCNCDLVKMRDLAQSSNIADFDEILCKAENGTQILVANLTAAYCDNVVADGIDKSIALAVLSGVACGVVLAVVLAYWKRNAIKARFNKCVGVAELNDVEKLYDVYLCSSRSDSEWVYMNIIALFQSEEISYRLCFHDDERSELSENAIADSMRESRRIVVVLTSNFVASDISTQHLETAYQHSIKDHVARLIIVVPDELPDFSNFPPKLAAFLRHNTCVFWKKPNFEEKLLFCMPKGKSNPQRPSEQDELELTSRA